MSDESADVGRCTRCGTEFSGRSSPMGLCPACLLKLGLSDPSWTPPAATEEREPEVAEAAREISVASPPSGGRLPAWRRPALVVAAVLLLVTVIASFLVRRTDAPPAVRVVRFHLPLPDETRFIDGAQLAVSPDGRQLVVALGGSAGPQLYLRSFAMTEWRALPGTAGASSPFWSPDSRQVGFFAEGRMRRLEIQTGLLFTVLDLPGGHGAAWGSDGFIVFASDATGTLWRVRATGGAPEMVTTLDEGETRHAWPWVLPDPHQVLFAASGLSPAPEDGSDSFLLATEKGARQPVVRGSAAAAYADGFLFSVQGSALVAQPFDASRRALRGDPQIVRGAEQIHGSLAAGSAFAVSSGVLVYRTGRPSLGRLTWLDRDGRAFDADMPPGEYRDASLSPDGTRLAVTRLDPRERTSNIWLVDLERKTTTRLTIGQAAESSPLWSPDGSRIAFVSVQEGRSRVCAASVSGGNRVERLVDLPLPVRLTDWSTDGRLILYSITSVNAGSDIWALPLTEKRQPFAVIAAPFNQSEGRLSPDGRWLAFTSNESGRDEVYVRAFPADEGRWQVSTGGGAQPRWLGDGSELHFVSSDRYLMATGVEQGDPLRFGPPRPLIELDAASGYLEGGRRVLVIAPVVEPGDRQLEVVLNWVDELER